MSIEKLITALDEMHENLGKVLENLEDKDIANAKWLVQDTMCDIVNLQSEVENECIRS